MKSKELTLLVILVCLAILHVTTAMVHINNLKTQITILKTQNEKLFKDIVELNKSYEKEIERLTGEYIGTFEATFYCATGNHTASGTWPEEGRTVATDPNLIPTGSEIRVVYPDGKSHIYTAEDTGGAIKGRILDVYVDSRKEALELGVKEVKVFVITVKGG